MNKLLLTTLVLAGLASAALAEERRLETDSYSTADPVMGVGSAIAGEAAIPAETAVRIQADGPLAQMRAGHKAAYDAMSQALANARDNAERESLEGQAVALKTAQQREELEFLKSAALQSGDAAYAASLDLAIRDLQPKVLPVPTQFVARDPQTGRALDSSVEGGAK